MHGHACREHIGCQARASTKFYLGRGLTRACEAPVDTTADQVGRPCTWGLLLCAVSRLTVLRDHPIAVHVEWTELATKGSFMRAHALPLGGGCRTPVATQGASFDCLHSTAAAWIAPVRKVLTAAAGQMTPSWCHSHMEASWSPRTRLYRSLHYTIYPCCMPGIGQKRGFTCRGRRAVGTAGHAPSRSLAAQHRAEAIMVRPASSRTRLRRLMPPSGSATILWVQKNWPFFVPK